jgi:hypothetical protein
MSLRDGRCDECGFHGWPDDPGVVGLHRRHHREWQFGAELRPRTTDDVVARLGEPAGLEILEFGPYSATIQQQRAERVVSAANRFHLHYDGPQYEAHETDNYCADHRTHVYVARLKGRGAGFVLLRWRTTYWELTWTQYDHGPRPDAPNQDPGRWCIDLVWVREDLRRRGVASSLLETAAQRLGVEVRDFAWRGPFKPGGEALARVLSPEFLRLA